MLQAAAVSPAHKRHIGFFYSFTESAAFLLHFHPVETYTSLQAGKRKQIHNSPESFSRLLYVTSDLQSKAV